MMCFPIQGITVRWAATLEIPPTVTTTAWDPGATVAGITKLTCVTPARPGGMPAKAIDAVTPPTVTDRGRRGAGSKPSGVAEKGEAPVDSEGQTSPSPVMKSVSVSPGFPLEEGTRAPDESVK